MYVLISGVRDRLVVRVGTRQGGPVIEKFSFFFPRVKPSFTGPPSALVEATVGRAVASFDFFTYVFWAAMRPSATLSRNRFTEQ
jgi:hypothetical protein